MPEQAMFVSPTCLTYTILLGPMRTKGWYLVLRHTVYIECIPLQKPKLPQMFLAQLPPSRHLPKQLTLAEAS
jgi:hypothetical protein